MHKEEQQQSRLASGSLGHKLKEARQKYDISTKAAAESLNLPEYIIYYIEQDEFAKLPGEVYIRGYVHSYAKFLRLDVNVVSHELGHYLNNYNKPVRKIGDSSKKNPLRKLKKFKLNLADTRRSKKWLVSTMIAGGVLALAGAFWLASVFNAGGMDQNLSVSSQKVSSK